jgi:hypothetical protein
LWNVFRKLQSCFNYFDQKGRDEDLDDLLKSTNSIREEEDDSISGEGGGGGIQISFCSQGSAFLA